MFVPIWYTVENYVNHQHLGIQAESAGIFERADQREQNTVQRGKKKPYTLIPMGEDDLYINVAILKRIKESLA